MATIDRPLTPPGSSTTQIHDILIIGAGPAGLAVAARLCEQTPAALFTDEEHRRYHWIRKSAPSRKILQAAASRTHRPAAPPTPPSSPPPSVAVPSLPDETGQRLGAYTALILDATGPRFLSRWDANFEKLCIPHLRSPLFFHIDPYDRDGLLAYAHERGRYAECIEIAGVVGKELSKHARKKRSAGRTSEGAALRIDERDRKDYLTPSTGLFRDHCAEVVRRYGLDEARLLRQEDVADVRYAACADLLGTRHECAHEDIFEVSTAAGTQLYARVVVVAAGPPMARLTAPLYPPDVACHASQITAYPHARVAERIQRGQGTHVVIVGGGLTSAQLADLAVRRGVEHVTLLMRGELKVKPFDVDLVWMGKFRNREKAAFWSADGDDERLEMIQTARNGGSIPAPYVRMLKQHQTRGRLDILTHTTLTDISTERDAQGKVAVSIRTATEPVPQVLQADYVYFATGPGGLRALNAAAPPSRAGHYQHDHEGRAAGVELPPPSAVPIPFLRSLQASHPIPWLNGLPALTDDLAWSGSCVHGRRGEFCGVPLYMTGAMAALRLGPGAANLEGARIGAERVVWGIQDALPRETRQSSSAGELDEAHEAYLDGRGGRYEGLLGLDASE